MSEQLDLLATGAEAAPEPPPAPPKPTGDGIERSAELSLDRRYRWLLRRSWAPGSAVLWVMLNPSTADGVEDDPTLRRCIAFSRAWGAGGLEVVNLAALYDETVDTIGGLCDRFVVEAAERCIAGGGRMLAGWGASIRFDKFAPFFLRQRDRRVLRMLTAIGDVHCLGTTASGAPIHPLARGRSRVPDDAQPVLFAAKGSMP